MRKFGKHKFILASAALALTGALSVGGAMAYFTSYSTAKGKVPVNIGFTKTVPEETVDGSGKHVTIMNTGAYDCFVRVKVFSVVDVDYKASEGWRAGDDGYWYYDKVVAAGASTSELLVTFEYPKNTEEDKTEEFDIVVVQECTPVVYDEDGTAIPNWDRVITDSANEE